MRLGRRPADWRRDTAFAATLGVALAAYNNVVVTQLPGYPASYVPANLAAGGLLLAAARWHGVGWADLGLAPGRMGAGVRWGGACFALVAAGYLAAFAVPVTRPLLADARVAGLTTGQLAYQVLVRIPLGTVVWEEVAFRGVLLTALARLMPLRWAVAASAGVFGVWHIRPTLSALALNDLTGTPVVTGAAVLLACVGTAVAGGFLCWVRLRSGSLLAPVLAHLATNSLGTLAAAAAQ